MPVPGSDLEATLHQHRYGRGLAEDGTPTVIKWAEVRFTAPGRNDVGGRYSLDTTYRIHGQRCYLTGSRSEVLVYALPELPEGDSERRHQPL